MALWNSTSSTQIDQPRSRCVWIPYDHSGCYHPPGTRSLDTSKIMSPVNQTVVHILIFTSLAHCRTLLITLRTGLFRRLTITGMYTVVILASLGCMSSKESKCTRLALPNIIQYCLSHAHIAKTNLSRWLLKRVLRRRWSFSVFHCKVWVAYRNWISHYTTEDSHLLVCESSSP